MKEFFATNALTILVAGAVVVSSLALVLRAPEASSEETMSFWEASARGLVSVSMVDETFDRGGSTVTRPVGIRVDNAASVPVAVSEEAVLMSPHPAESPSPDALSTTQDAVLTNHTIPPGGSLTYFYGEDVLQKYLPEPPWWCAEEFQFSKADVRFHVGGETLPFAMRPILANRHYESGDSNTQIDFWTYLRGHSAVVVGKEPLWTSIDAAAGAKVPVRLRATNLAIYTHPARVATDVNVTGGAIEDSVPVGWSVEEGSYSIPPTEIVGNPDGSKTLRWIVDLPAAAVPENTNPLYPTNYVTRTFSYVLLSPSQNAGRIELPRGVSDMDRNGIPDAHSAVPIVDVTSPGPLADAGGPYSGVEGSTITLDASKSSSPQGLSLQFRWDLTDNGVFDTPWSSNPLVDARYTDDLHGSARVEVSDGTNRSTARASVTIANLPPEILRMRAGAEVDFRLTVAGEKWHDVTLTVASGSDSLAAIRVVREPGSPATQSVATGSLALEFTKPLSARIVYTPADDPVNGQPEGANPAWLTVVFADRNETKFFHEFNVRHESTWTWTIDDLASVIAREGLMLRADLRDPGSDDLTVTWDFGDGTTATQVFYNNGVGPDLPESQDGIAPFLVTATAVHAFAGPGDYTIRLIVRDDDGGETSATMTLHVG